MQLHEAVAVLEEMMDNLRDSRQIRAVEIGIEAVLYRIQEEARERAREGLGD